MKITTFFAAIGLTMASLGAATAAEAQHHRGSDRYERHHDGRGDRGFRDDRGRHGYRHDRRGYRGDRCRVEYRHHRRVRICR